MKKIGKWSLAVLLMAILVTSLMACKQGGEKTPEKTTEKATKAPITTEATTEEATTKEPEVDPSTYMDMRDISSMDLVKEIGLGWNLGNTLDSIANPTIKAPRAYETAWGNPVTTKELIQTVSEAGFNTIRIPITWEGKFGEGPDYIIMKAWMDRVQEIVDYAYEFDMFVIINMHHEEWHFPSTENYKLGKEMIIKLWEQIANRFQGYDEKLIFEGMNEPRLKGTPQEWNGGNESAREVIAQWNLAFVETIRNAPGNNAKRHLMIQGHAAASDDAVLQAIRLPKDDDKIIVSVHAYSPYNFALNTKGTSEFDSTDESDVAEIKGLMSRIRKHFISKGVPVLIGEFGAMNKDNEEIRADWAEYYVKSAKEIGVKCIWWDNGAFAGNGELFGLIDRRKYEIAYPLVLEGLLKGLE